MDHAAPFVSGVPMLGLLCSQPRHETSVRRRSRPWAHR